MIDKISPVQLGSLNKEKSYLNLVLTRPKRILEPLIIGLYVYISKRSN